MSLRAPRDDNRVPTLLGVDSILFATPTTVAVNPATHAMLVEALITPSGTQDVNLAKVGGASFALGQQLAASSLPIVLTASQLTTLTPPAAITNYALETGGNLATLVANQTNSTQIAAISRTNTGIPAYVPTIVQKTSNVSSSNVASLAKAFTTNTVAGNSIVVVCGVGNTTTPTVTDTQGNTYTLAKGQLNGSSQFNVGVFYATGIVGGANTVTVNNGGTATSIAMEIYEVSGLITQVNSQPSQTGSGQGTSTTASAGSVSPLSPNEYGFAAVGLLSANTITPSGNWTNDSGQLNPGSPSGLVGFATMSQFFPTIQVVAVSATFSSTQWAIAYATFRPVILGISGPVNAPTATGSTIPSNAFYVGMSNSSNNLVGMQQAPANLNSGGGGLYTTVTAQLDDTSPTTVSENNFGVVRMDSGRQLRVNNQSAPDATKLTTYQARITTNTTTTPTAATAYISSITITSEVAGTTSTITIQDKQGTPRILVNGFATAALTTTPTVINFQTPILMTSGIDIITAGAVAATVDVWINYFQ